MKSRNQKKQKTVDFCEFMEKHGLMFEKGSRLEPDERMLQFETAAQEFAALQEPQPQMEHGPNTEKHSKFWMVYVEGRSAPARRHETLHEAAAEAERLCLVERKPAFVLEAVNSVEPAPKVVWGKMMEEF